MSESTATDGLGYLFMLTYGRSGSTLLNGILNSIPGYLIRGENQGALNDLFRVYKTAERRKAVVESELASQGGLAPQGVTIPNSGVTHPWYGFEGVPLDTLTACIRNLMVDVYLRPTPGTRVTGFKEIRYPATLSSTVTQTTVETPLVEVVQWMRRVFPGARMVINRRDLAATSKSYWWAEHEDSLDRLASVDSALLDVADAIGDAGFSVTYDDYKDNPAALRALFDWLGEDFDEARVADVMSIRHSYR